MTRAALAAAGFVRQEVEGTVYFESGVIPSAVEGSPADAATHVASGGDPSTALGMTRRTLVLVHGANDQAGTWFTVAPALAQRCRVIIPDLAGHGESEPRTGPLPIPLLVDKLHTVLRNERELTLVGNSLGGWLVLLYALRYPEQIKHLYLEASGGLNRPLAVPLVAHNHDEAMVVLRAVHGPDFQSPQWVIDALIERASGSPMLRLTEVAESQIEDRLGEIQIPATLIWGAHDGVLPRDYAEALRQALPNATLHVLEGAAHIPHMQQPERFLQCLTATS